MFATSRPHAFPGAALQDQLTRGQPCDRKWTCETKAEEVLKPHSLSVLPCSMLKVEEMFAITFFLISWTVYLSCYQRKKWWRWRTPVGWDTDSVCIWLPGAPKKRRGSGSKEPGGLSLSRDSCSGRHQMGTKPGEWAAFPKRQPELLAARRERD